MRLYDDHEAWSNRERKLQTWKSGDGGAALSVSDLNKSCLNTRSAMKQPLRDVASALAASALIRLARFSVLTSIWRLRAAGGGARPHWLFFWI